MRVEKKNGICYIDGMLKPKEGISDSTVLLNGLPIPKIGTHKYIPTTQISPVFARTLYLSANIKGELSCRYGSNTNYYFNTSYPYVE